MNRKEQAVIFFRHDEFLNIDLLYTVTWYISIVEEGLSIDYFNEEIDEAVEGEDNNEGPEIEEDTSITDAIRQINCLRIGGEFERRKFENVGLVVNDNNDPPPENTPTERNNTDNE